MHPRSWNPRLRPHLNTIKPSPHQYGFKNIVTPESCQMVIDQLKLKEKYPNSEGRLNIVDVFSGYGLLSSMINYELKPKNHLIIDDTKENLQIWQHRLAFLEERTGNQENFRYFKNDGHSWGTYDNLVGKDKFLEPEFQSRDKIHHELLIVGNLTSSKFGESLFAQWIMCCAYQNWLQKYGRVRMVLLVPEPTALKFLGGPNFPKRNRSALKRDMFTESKLIAVSDSAYETRRVAGELYDPNLLVRDQPVVIPSGSILPANSDLAVVEIVPRDMPLVDVHAFEYLTQIFMYRSTNTVMMSLRILAPGADTDLAPLIPKELLNKTARQLSRDDLSFLLKVYNSWAFRPLYEDTLNFLSEETRSF